MFTSLIQYLLMAPTFVNIINIYAFCNTHDGECVVPYDVACATT